MSTAIRYIDDHIAYLEKFLLDLRNERETMELRIKIYEEKLEDFKQTKKHVLDDINKSRDVC